MSVLYIIRHGQASFGQADYDQLSDLGRRQAKLTGQYLRAACITPHAVFAGALRRQGQTARAALAGLATPEPSLLPGLDEYDSGAILKALLPAMLREDPSLEASLDGMYQDRRSFQVIYEGAMRRWVSGQYDLDGCETWRAFQERAASAWQQVLTGHQSGKTVVAFTSGGPIAAILQQALGLEDQMALKMTWVIKNASLTSVFYNGRDLTLSSFNSTAHLEQHGDPGLITYR